MTVHMDDKEIEKLKFFIKTGIVVLTFMLICGIAIKYIPKVVTVTNSATSKKIPIYSVDEDEHKIALSFDSTYNNEDTAKILEILAVYDIKATFFIKGDWIDKFPDEVKSIAAAGHDLGNHSDNYKHMSNYSKEQSVEDIMKLHDKVIELTGIEMNLFRPPYGDYSNTLIEATIEAGYHCVLWDVDSMDWKDYGTESIINTVVNNENLSNGSIILCHNGAKYTKDALEPMIIDLIEKGYKIVPISELIYTSDYYIDNDGRQFER